MSLAQSTSRKKDFLKTLLLHTATIFILCWTFHGIVLFLFPPLLFFWFAFALLLTTLHRLIHRRVLIHYFMEDVLVQIWLNPLLLMGGWLAITIICIFSADFMNRADIWRQILQIPVAAFSRVTIVYFSTIILSSTFLFIELIFIWLPKLQKIHFNEKSRRKSRITLLGLSLFMVFILFYLGVQKRENIVYISATMLARWGDNPAEAIMMFKKIPPAEKRLYMAAVYRIARIYQLKLKDFPEARKWFDIIINSPDSPLRDDAMYQSLQCLIQLKNAPEQLLSALRNFTNNFPFSNLLDEASFAIAEVLTDLRRWNEAADIYRKLQQYPGWSYTLFLHQNQYIHNFRLTRELAKERLNELHGRISPE